MSIRDVLETPPKPFSSSLTTRLQDREILTVRCATIATYRHCVCQSCSLRYQATVLCTYRINSSRATDTATRIRSVICLDLKFKFDAQRAMNPKSHLCINKTGHHRPALQPSSSRPFKHMILPTIKSPDC
jgi:hypothetical protein